MKALVRVLPHRNSSIGMGEELIILTTARKILKVVDIETMTILTARTILKVNQISDSAAKK